jgi:hypothetical protein
MRAWMTGLVGLAAALVIDLIIWPVLPNSFARFAIAGLSLYAIFVLLISTAVFLVRLRRLRVRLAKLPRTPEELQNAFSGTGLERLARRIFDLSPADAAPQPQVLLLQSRVVPSQARHEVKSLFRDWLIRAQFLTALLLLIGVCGLSALNAYSAIMAFPVVLPFSLLAAALLAVIIIAVFCEIVLQAATERLLDAIVLLPTERLDAHLLVQLADFGKRANEPSPTPTPMAGVAYERALERLGLLLEGIAELLQNSAKDLTTCADLLASTMRASSDREERGSILREEGSAAELKIVLEELIRAIRPLTSMIKHIPDAIKPSGADTAPAGQNTANVDLGREVQRLLKEFE